MDYKTYSKNRKQKFWFFGIIIVFFIIASFISENKGSGNKNDVFEFKVERFIKNQLKDPGSYESMRWFDINPENGQRNGLIFDYTIRHIYTAKNSFNATIKSDQIFYLTKDGVIIDYEDTADLLK